jgi:hypothetical protein
VPHILSTLAAACAETGDFESAVKWSQKGVEVSQKSIEATEDAKQKEKMKTEHEQLTKELANYQEKKPWRERQTMEGTSHAEATEAKESAPSEKAVSDRK